MKKKVPSIDNILRHLINIRCWAYVIASEYDLSLNIRPL